MFMEQTCPYLVDLTLEVYELHSSITLDMVC